jgi:phosphopantothenoylcysteine synthetase/decarboxylase
MTRNVILGISGSIAAFRAADIASQLTKLGCSVTAVMTADAQEFITPLTLKVLSRNPVVTSLYNEKDSWHPGHIQLADAANLLLIAKLAHGIADDALSAIALATRAPILIAPAMNGHMWLHPATVRNTATLRSWGHQFIGPDDGLLSCGYEGIGRLSPVTDIVNQAIHLLSQSPSSPPSPPQPP